jgi:uncharacterized protein YjbI with pentapeptide repeats
MAASASDFNETNFNESNFNTILTKLQNTTRTSDEDKELSNMMNGMHFTKKKEFLKNLNFSKLTLTNVTFNGAKIMNCNFDYSTLVKCSFEGAEIGAKDGETTFNWAILEGTNFKNTQIWDTSFYGAYLKDATFENSGMSGVSFVDSILLNARFDNSLFELYAGETDFDGAVTIGATFVDIVADEDDDVNPVVSLINNHNPSQHLVTIKGLDEDKINNHFKKIRHMKQIRDTYTLRPLRKLVLNSLKGEDLEYAKGMLPHLFPGQIDKKLTFSNIGGRRKNTKKRILTRKTKRKRTKSTKRRRH